MTDVTSLSYVGADCPSAVTLETGPAVPDTFLRTLCGVSDIFVLALRYTDLAPTKALHAPHAPICHTWPAGA